MHEAWRVCLLSVLVVLAGCGGATSDDATPTLTPVAVEETTQATPTPERIAPGVSARSVADPEALLAAHVATLGNTTVWFTFNRTITRGDDLVRQRLVEGVAGPNASRYAVNVTLRGADRTVNRTYRRQGERIFVETEGPPGVSRSNESLPVDPYFEGQISRLLLSLAGFEVRRPAANGSEGFTAGYFVTADRFAADRTRAGGNVSFRAAVAPSGIVVAYEIRYNRIRNGTVERVRESLSYDTVVFESANESRGG